MQDAAAQHPGGDPTDPNHTFIYEAVVQDGHAIKLTRTGLSAYVFCSDAVQSVQGVLAREGVPEDGTYTFRIKRDETATATFATEGGEPREYSQRTAGYFVMTIARTDIAWLFRGLRPFGDDYYQQCTAHIARQALQGHIIASPLMEEPFPPADMFEFLPTTEEHLLPEMDQWQMEGPIRAFQIDQFLIAFRQRQVHVMYTGKYHPWGLVYAHRLTSYLVEHFAASYRNEALRELGYNLSRFSRVERMNSHLRTLLGDIEEGEVNIATKEADAAFLQEWEQKHGHRGQGNRPFGFNLRSLFDGMVGMTLRRR